MSPASRVAPRQVGIPPATAAEQLQKSFPPTVPTQPLPAGQGGRAKAADLGVHETTPLSFFVIGDHGGINDPNPQNAVTLAMEAQAAPAFVYSVGDVVYFNADAAQWTPQFYEAYAHLAVPFLSIPGNHDGDTIDDPKRTPLDTWMANFCAAKPALPVGSEEYERDVQTQPYCDWTLQCAAVTIVGLYSNVPSGGHLEQSQIDWLTGELKAADPKLPLILTLHHPPYSVDAHHGGSQKMGIALDSAFTASGRLPQLVISGHVHDYQRFTRTNLAHPIPYIVIGNSGYHNLHKLAPGSNAGEQLAPGVTFEYGDDSEYGFLKLTVQGGKISGEYFGVTPGVTSNAPPRVTAEKDTF
jgi:acid phosphatase type 7